MRFYSLCLCEPNAEKKKPPGGSFGDFFKFAFSKQTMEILTELESNVSSYSTPPPVLTDADTSDFADALSFFLTELEAPRKLRDLIIAAVGLAAGRSHVIRFYAFDLARRIWRSDWSDDPDERKRERERLQRNVSRVLTQLREWAAARGLPLVYKSGYRDAGTGEAVASLLKLSFLPWIAEIVNLCRQNPKFRILDNRQRATQFRWAVRCVLRSHKKEIKKRQPPEKREQTEGQISKALLTYASKKVELVATINGEGTQAAINSVIWSLAAQLERKYGGMVDTFDPYPPPERDTRQNVESESQGGQPLPVPVWAYGETPGDVLADTGDSEPIPPCDSYPASDAQLAIEAFASVGGAVDRVILKDDEAATKPTSQRVTAEQFRAEVGELIHDARQAGLSLIGRVRGDGILQVDDCEREAVELLKPFSFLTVETSPANYQCWVAFKDDEDKQAARYRLLAGLNSVLPNTKANSGSGGAIRWPGSQNFKPNRRGPDGEAWRVRIAHAAPGHTVTPSLLDEVGLLAPEEKPKAATVPTRYRSTVKPYADYLATAPKRQRDKQPDRSRADQSFVNQLIGAGWCDEDICAELLQASERAKEKGLAYVRRTIQSGRSYCGAGVTA